MISISLFTKNIAVLVFTCLMLTIVINAQEKPKSCTHDMKQQKESLDQSKMDHSKQISNSAPEKNCEAGKTTTKSCCSSEAGAAKEAKIETSKPWNAVCPVMGEEIDPEIKTVEYKGKTIGFCCDKCLEKFNKDPEAYMKKLSKDGKKIIES